MSAYTVKCPYCDVAKPNHRLPMHMTTMHRAEMAAEIGIVDSLRGSCGSSYLLGGQTYYISFGTENGRGTIFKSSTWASKHMHERCNAECKEKHMAKAAELLTLVCARVTSENAANYIGCNIEFKTNGKMVTRTITGVSPSGKTIYVDFPELNNNLDSGRAIYLSFGPKTLKVKRLKEVAAEVKEVADRVAAVEMSLAAQNAALSARITILEEREAERLKYNTALDAEVEAFLNS